jgi:hypothetical protein
VASREQRRAQLVPALARITRRPDFRASLSRAAGSDGGLTIIPVLPDDRMGYVFDRLREADDRGVVAMHVGGEWRIAITWPTTPARATVARDEDDNIAVVHDDSEVAMFFDYLDQSPTLVMDEIVARLMPGSDLQLT